MCAQIKKCAPAADGTQGWSSGVPLRSVMDGASAKQSATASRASSAACSMPVFVGGRTSSRTRRSQGGMGDHHLGVFEFSCRMAFVEVDHASAMVRVVVFQTLLPRRSWWSAASAPSLWQMADADEGLGIGPGTASRHVGGGPINKKVQSCGRCSLGKCSSLTIILM